MGDMVIQLDADKAPKTVANFVQYVKDGLLRRLGLPPRDRRLHDQGGGYDAEMKEKPTRPSIPLEAATG